MPIKRYAQNGLVAVAVLVTLAASAFAGSAGVKSAAATHTAAAAASFALSGVFVVNSFQVHGVNGVPTGMINADVLADDSVNGYLVNIGWGSIETSEGTYAWGPIDSVIAQVAAVGKQITIDVLPAYETPAWVYADGAQSFSFVWNEPWGPGPCVVQQIPIPWDPVFIAKWTAFIAAFGARYNSNLTVAAVKIVGVNSVDEETTLPFSVFATIPEGTGSCVSDDDVTDWQAVGYTRTLVESAWEQFAAAYQAAFPDKPLIAAMQIGGFPPLDQNGDIIPNATDGQDTQATLDIIASAVATQGNQFVLDNDGLLDGFIWPTEAGYSNQIQTGYQTIAPLANLLPGAMKLALAANVHYLELYPSDVLTPSLSVNIANTAKILELEYQ